MFKIYTPPRDGWSEDDWNNVEQDFSDLELRVDEDLKFFRGLVPKIESGEELVTVRFSPGKVRISREEQMPWYETDRDNSDYCNLLGRIRVPAIGVGHLRDFPEGFALLDEYESKEEMIRDLEDIYNTQLNPDDVISGYLLSGTRRIERQ